MERLNASLQRQDDDGPLNYSTARICHRLVATVDVPGNLSGNSPLFKASTLCGGWIRSDKLQRIMKHDAHKVDNRARWILLAAVMSAIVQVLWFARVAFRQIDIDGIDYLGVARHIVNGQFHAAINGFRSPLISWLVAALHPLSSDLVLVGKVVSVSSFLILVILTYFFTKSLWRSEMVASLAALWITSCRGLPSFAIQFVSPDIMFAVLTVAYFGVLLTCLRDDEPRSWFFLGAIHGVAFFCKAFALPWLGVTTVLALCVRCERRFRVFLIRFVAAMLVPVLAAASWAVVLHSKYGEFTTGTQFKVNLLQSTLRAYRGRRPLTYAVLIDQTPNTDQFMAGDPMPPGSWPWQYKINWTQALPKVVASEVHLLPSAIKEILVLITPGGALALLFVGIALIRRRNECPWELRMVLIIGASTVTLVLAYCMLAFDGRYVYPLLPLLLAVSSRALVNDSREQVPLEITLRSRISIGLLTTVGILFSVLYWASPFRTLKEDYETSCYRAAARLKTHPGATLVSLGSGPYPEFGVGWEAGFKTAFFANRRLIARLDDLPSPDLLKDTVADLVKARADAVLIWGNPDDQRYVKLVDEIGRNYASAAEVDDPKLGDVGTIFFRD
jgi:hypothetical protein